MLASVLGNILAIMGLGGQEMLFILLVLLVPVGWLVCSIIALSSALQGNFQGSSDKLIWVLVILFLPYFGPLLYFTIGRQQWIV